METIRRACTRLGIASLLSWFASLVVLMFLAEPPQVVRWFVASGALTVLAFGTAAIAAYFDSTRP